jgi:hypothetical protein
MRIAMSETGDEGRAMKSALALASVTAILKNLLENGLVAHGVTANVGADTTISALPPDRIKTGDDERAQLNLFLYQVTPRGLNSSSRYAPEGNPNRRPGTPLTLELLYLLTAYGAQDYHTEILLGYALSLFQENPVVTAAAIRKILAEVSSAEGGKLVLPALAALASPELAGQLHQITLCPQLLPGEEMSKLWSTLQTRYRPSMVYKATVALGDPARSEEAA